MEELISLGKELSSETMERIVKIIQDGNPLWNVAIVVGYSRPMNLNLTANIKKSGLVKKKRKAYRLPTKNLNVSEWKTNYNVGLVKW